MTGIYLFTNLINGKNYIGQSVDIQRRYSEHLRSGQPEKYVMKNERDSNTPIHLAIQKYGVNNFSFRILEECSREQLNEREKYWIKMFRSNEKEYGYNVTEGGQESIGCKGENHSQAKLTQQDVDNIKILLKENKKSMTEIIDLYPVSKSTISMINQGKIWAEPDEQYPLRQTYTGLQGSKNHKAKFTEEQVMEMRKLYASGKKPSEIYPLFNNIASNSAIEAILYGKTYTHLPIWKNKTKEWINPQI